MSHLFIRLSFLFLTALMVLPGVAEAKRAQFTVDTSPMKGGRVMVNGNFMGVAPAPIEIFGRKNDVVVITVELEGGIAIWPRSETLKDLKGLVKVRMEEDEAFSNTIDSQVANKWLTLEPNKTLGEDGKADQDKIWQKLVSVVTDNFSDLEQMDRQSYYLRTAWRVRGYDWKVMRNRLVVKLGVGLDFAIKVQLESQVATKKKANQAVSDEDFEAYDRVLRSDKETMDFLRDQL